MPPQAGGLDPIAEKDDDDDDATDKLDDMEEDDDSDASSGPLPSSSSLSILSRASMILGSGRKETTSQSKQGGRLRRLCLHNIFKILSENCPQQ